MIDIQVRSPTEPCVDVHCISAILIGNHLKRYFQNVNFDVSCIVFQPTMRKGQISLFRSDLGMSWIDAFFRWAPMI